MTPLLLLESFSSHTSLKCSKLLALRQTRVIHQKYSPIVSIPSIRIVRPRQYPSLSSQEGSAIYPCQGIYKGNRIDFSCKCDMDSAQSHGTANRQTILRTHENDLPRRRFPQPSQLHYLNFYCASNTQNNGWSYYFAIISLA